MSTISEASLTKTPIELQQWQQRIKAIQLSRATPEVIQRIRDTSERAENAKKMMKQASKIERINYISSASNQSTLNKFKSAEKESMSSGIFSGMARDQVQKKMVEESAVNSSRSKTLQRVLKSSPPPQQFQAKSLSSMVGMKAPVCIKNDDNDDEAQYDLNDSEEEELHLMEADLFCIPANEQLNINIGAAQEVIASDIDQLLLQFVKEPTDETELTAKFQLFENFLETVTLIRETTIQFWEENKQSFDGPTRTQGDASIKKIDSADNLGIQDDESKWFIYFMTKQANNNSRLISAILSKFKSQLNLLSQELGECPFCLDQMVAGSGKVVTLSCCHRCCTDCWTNWAELKGASAFCPLCNHPQFVGEIAQDI